MASVYTSLSVVPCCSARLFAASDRASGTPLMLVERSGQREWIMVANHSTMSPSFARLECQIGRGPDLEQRVAPDREDGRPFEPLPGVAGAILICLPSEDGQGHARRPGDDARDVLAET